VKKTLVVLVGVLISGCASMLPPTIAPTAEFPLRSDRVSGILTDTPSASALAELPQETNLPNIDSNETDQVLISSTPESTDTLEESETIVASEDFVPGIITATIQSSVTITVASVASETLVSTSATVTPVSSNTSVSTIIIPTSSPEMTSIPSTETQVPPSQVPPTNISIPASATNAPATNTPIPQPTNTPIPPGCSPGQNSSLESQVLSLINQERANAGLSALSSQSQLTNAARGHSEDMGCNGFFSHTSPTTGSPFDRIVAAGYSYSWAGENIAAGYGTAAQVVSGWMSSTGHRNNILNPSFTQTGVGYIYVSGSPYGSYWTQTFGAP
jgi:uncharacterized protein YkwD